MLYTSTSLIITWQYRNLFKVKYLFSVENLHTKIWKQLSHIKTLKTHNTFWSFIKYQPRSFRTITCTYIRLVFGKNRVEKGEKFCIWMKFFLLVKNRNIPHGNQECHARKKIIYAHRNRFLQSAKSKRISKKNLIFHFDLKSPFLKWVSSFSTSLNNFVNNNYSHYNQNSTSKFTLIILPSIKV